MALSINRDTDVLAQGMVFHQIKMPTLCSESRAASHFSFYEPSVAPVPQNCCNVPLGSALLQRWTREKIHLRAESRHKMKGTGQLTLGTEKSLFEHCVCFMINSTKVLFTENIMHSLKLSLVIKSLKELRHAVKSRICRSVCKLQHCPLG